MEMASRIPRQSVDRLTSMPEMARISVESGMSPEAVVLIRLRRENPRGFGSVTLRGVTDAAYVLRRGRGIVRGRAFRAGVDEVVVGRGVVRAFQTDVGHTIPVGRRSLVVVGVFEHDGAVSESEIWTSLPIVQEMFGLGRTVQSIRIRLASPAHFWDLESMTIRPSPMGITVRREVDLYRSQARVMEVFVSGFAWLVLLLMALAVTFVTLNTMYAAVASRSKEMATLRALGYGRLPVAIGVVGESFVLSLMGSVVGATMAYSLFDGYVASTTNVASLSHLTFSFRVNGNVVVHAVLAASVIGTLGALPPAVIAARTSPVSGLRAAY